MSTNQLRNASTNPAYWVRPGLDVRGGVLHIAGKNAVELAQSLQLPVFVTELASIGSQAAKLNQALLGAGLKPRIRLALKAQREPAILRYIRGLGQDHSTPRVGIDACSPNEVDYALAHGWAAHEISCTGTNMNDSDMQRIINHGVHMNLDLLSQLDRFGRLNPGATAGIRVNPQAGAMWDGRSSLYASTKPTKFGIYKQQIPEAIEIARRHEISLTTLHFHVVDGVLNEGMSAFERAVKAAAKMTRMLMDAGFPIREVNAGGGLGIPLREQDSALDLDGWAHILKKHLEPLDVIVGTEPGNFLTKPSTVVLAEVVTVEDRLGKRFIGLNVGWNVLSFKFLYDMPFTIVPCVNPLARPAGTATISGNINEGNDLFAEDIPFPVVSEGEYVAILNAGGYNQAMQSDHCLRQRAGSVCF